LANYFPKREDLKGFKARGGNFLFWNPKNLFFQLRGKKKGGLKLNGKYGVICIGGGKKGDYRAFYQRFLEDWKDFLTQLFYHFLGWNQEEKV